MTVGKKDGGVTICLDFRELNSIIEDDKHPLPNTDDVLQGLGQATIFSALDLQSGYHQIKLHEDSCNLTAFSTHDGHYEYVVLPFGLKDAPASFQQIVNQVLTGLIGRACQVYLIDILISSRSFKEHVAHLRQVMERLDEACLSIKMEKCTFFADLVDYLGHKISKEGNLLQPEKVAVVKNFPNPQTL